MLLTCDYLSALFFNHVLCNVLSIIALSCFISNVHALWLSIFHVILHYVIVY